MRALRDMGVLKDSHLYVSEQRLGIDCWNSVRVLLEVVRCGSFRAASQHSRLSVNTLRNHLSELERQLGVVLVTRHVDGVRLTKEGQEVLAVAKSMESASFALVRAKQAQSVDLKGEVRLAVTEGLGTFWVAPRLVEFQQSHPQLLVDMACGMEAADITRMEADIAVQIVPPTASDLKMVKIGRLHVMPFASQGYAATHGLPSSIEDVLKHRLVLQVDENVTSSKEYDQLFPGVAQSGFVAMRTNVSSAHYWLIAKGAGIGMLPTYASALGSQLVPVDIGLRRHFDIWLSYHADAGRIPRIRRLIDWLLEAFNAKKFPWFGDDFIHPNELKTMVGGKPTINMFSGFAGE